MAQVLFQLINRIYQSLKKKLYRKVHSHSTSFMAASSAHHGNPHEDSSQAPANALNSTAAGASQLLQHILSVLTFQAGRRRTPARRSLLPVRVSSVEELGNVRSLNTFVKRDLGFQGQIGNNVVLTYGDTLYSDADNSDTWRGMTSNSVALASRRPMHVWDVHLNAQRYPQQFCPTMAEYGEDSSTHAIGITNVVETHPGQGIVYFLKNHRPDGVNHLIGAGVAIVRLLHINMHLPFPSLQRLGDYWWDAEVEPWYGDVGALRCGAYIYAYGHAKSTPYVYLARVPWEDATDLSRYEYWNGRRWQRERLYHPTDKEGVLWQINQGQVIWSHFYGCFLFVYCDTWMNSKVLVKAAHKPEGPWSEPITLYQATPITPRSSIYAAIPHPYYDPSGPTLVVTFTNHPNTIQAIKVTFASHGQETTASAEAEASTTATA